MLFVSLWISSDIFWYISGVFIISGYQVTYFQTLSECLLSLDIKWHIPDIIRVFIVPGYQVTYSRHYQSVYCPWISSDIFQTLSECCLSLDIKWHNCQHYQSVACAWIPIDIVSTFRDMKNFRLPLNVEWHTVTYFLSPCFPDNVLAICGVMICDIPRYPGPIPVSRSHGYHPTHMCSDDSSHHLTLQLFVKLSSGTFLCHLVFDPSRTCNTLAHERRHMYVILTFMNIV